MRNILIIAYFYNDEKIIGSIRLRALVKYLPKLGWNPIVITSTSIINKVQSEQIFSVNSTDISKQWRKFLSVDENVSLKESRGLRDVKGGNTLYDRAIKLWQECFLYPDAAKPWIQPTLAVIDNIVASNHIDLILSSSYPASSHIIASKVCKKYNIPWVADFRDLWTQNCYYPWSPIRKICERNLELKTLKIASALTTVSHHLSRDLFSFHKIETCAILNGFDDDIKNGGIQNVSKLFTIVYTGTLYQGKRDPEPLFKALNSLIQKGLVERKELDVQFFGEKSRWLTDEVNKYDLGDIIRINGSIPRDEALQQQRESQILLIIVESNPQTSGVLTGKIFDYISARRPVVHLGGIKCELSDLIREIGIGATVEDAEGLESLLNSYYQEYKQNGIVKYHGDSEKIAKYSHFEMVKKFVNIFEAVVKYKE
jgi:hypothetical protein